MSNAITLNLHRAHWVKDDGEDPTDQCAHGEIEFAIDDVMIVSPDDGSWTVSAAALYLLRSVSVDHNDGDPVDPGNYLIPCCAFQIVPSAESRHPYSILGCNNGVDPEIRHSAGKVIITFGEKSCSVSLLDWARAVLRFSEQVKQFYDASAPRAGLEESQDRREWAWFWQHWNEQAQEVRQLIREGNSGD